MEALEQGRRAAGVAIKRYRALEAGCRCRDVEVWRSGTRCRWGDVKAWNSGALAERCGPGDVEVWRYGGMERWTAGVAIWRCGGTEL